MSAKILDKLNLHIIAEPGHRHAVWDLNTNVRLNTFKNKEAAVAFLDGVTWAVKHLDTLSKSTYALPINPNDDDIVDRLVRRAATGEKSAPLKLQPDPAFNQVWRDKSSGAKFAITSETRRRMVAQNPTAYEYVTDRPHGEPVPDFSYLCNGSYCRCSD